MFPVGKPDVIGPGPYPVGDLGVIARGWGGKACIKGGVIEGSEISPDELFLADKEGSDGDVGLDIPAAGRARGESVLSACWR